MEEANMGEEETERMKKEKHELAVIGDEKFRKKSKRRCRKEHVCHFYYYGTSEKLQLFGYQSCNIFKVLQFICLC